MAGPPPPDAPDTRAPSRDPLHGVTLQAIVEDLQARYGWQELAQRIPIRCFQHEPSLRSSLKFLRKVPWARAKVERLYIADHKALARKRKRNAMRAARRAYKASLEADVAAPSGPPERPASVDVSESPGPSAHAESAALPPSVGSGGPGEGSDG